MKVRESMAVFWGQTGYRKHGSTSYIDSTETTDRDGQTTTQDDHTAERTQSTYDDTRKHTIRYKVKSHKKSPRECVDPRVFGLTLYHSRTHESPPSQKMRKSPLWETILDWGARQDNKRHLIGSLASYVTAKKPHGSRHAHREEQPATKQPRKLTPGHAVLPPLLPI